MYVNNNNRGKIRVLKVRVMKVKWLKGLIQYNKIMEGLQPVLKIMLVTFSKSAETKITKTRKK